METYDALVNLRSIEHQETWAINMYSIARDILCFPNENETYRGSCRYANTQLRFVSRIIMKPRVSPAN